MDSSEIYKSLRRHFCLFDYLMENKYIFNHDWETDFYCMSSSRYSYEVEVKVSRGDFLADLKKYKHELFRNVKKNLWVRRNGDLNLYIPDPNNPRRSIKEIVGSHIQIIDNSKSFIPHRFYFAAPAGMLTLKDIPAYAGLIEVNGECRVTKAAPFLHKRYIQIEKILLEKLWVEVKGHRLAEEFRNSRELQNEYK